MEDEKRELNRMNSLKFKERFQFILSIDGNIACQRFFKIKGLREESLSSKEFYDTVDYCVRLIKADLVSKSRAYMWYTNSMPIQLTGFDHTREDDPEYKRTYLDYYAVANETAFLDEDVPTGEECKIKFTLKDGSHVLYECIWDGSIYPKYVRNSVDLKNSDASYRDLEGNSLPFSVVLLKAMNSGKEDLVWKIINEIYKVCSSENYTDEYTLTDEYGDKEYSLHNTSKDFIKEWSKDLAKETSIYYAWAANYVSDGTVEYIDKYL